MRHSYECISLFMDKATEGKFDKFLDFVDRLRARKDHDEEFGLALNHGRSLLSMSLIVSARKFAENGNIINHDINIYLSKRALDGYADANIPLSESRLLSMWLIYKGK